MAMILAGDVLPEQLGAFLMLLRVKEESPEEIAGFVRAACEAWRCPPPLPHVDLDWSSYAGKRRQLPWFILVGAASGAERLCASSCTAQRAIRAGRVYTREALRALGIPVAASFDEAAAHLGQRQFRLPAARAISRGAGAHHQPAPYSGAALAGPYALAHAQSVRRPCDAARHLSSRLYANPPKSGAAARSAAHGRFPRRRRRDRAASEQTLRGADGPSTVQRPRNAGPLFFPSRVSPPRTTWTSAACWRSGAAKSTDEYGEAAICGTLAIALKALGRAEARKMHRSSRRICGRIATGPAWNAAA